MPSTVLNALKILSYIILHQFQKINTEFLHLEPKMVLEMNARSSIEKRFYWSRYHVYLPPLHHHPMVWRIWATTLNTIPIDGIPGTAFVPFQDMFSFIKLDLWKWSLSNSFRLTVTGLTSPKGAQSINQTTG